MPQTSSSSQNLKPQPKPLNILQKMLKIQVQKYKSKGIKNSIIALILLFGLYFAAPRIGRAIWPAHVENKILFQVFVQTSLSLLVTAIYLLQYLPGYCGVAWYKTYEVSPGLKKPWEKQDWNSKRRSTLILTLFNKAVIFPLYLYLILNLAGVRTDYSLDTFPTSWQLFTTIFKIQFVDDFIFMCVHRSFHQFPMLYKFHKVHHSYQTVWSIIGQYCHPVEQIFGIILPATISFSFFRTHTFTFLFWTSYKLYMSCQGHSGYEFPWSPFRILPFVYGAAYHQFHHTHNVGNFATAFYVSQLVFGTNWAFFQHQFIRLKDKEEQQKQNIKQLQTNKLINIEKTKQQ